MLAVVKTPHTKLRMEGEIPAKVLSFLKSYYGKKLQVEETTDDAVVLVRDTSWYKKMKKTMTPGKEIRGHRELLGITQEQLGEKLGGKSRQYVSDLENGRRSVSKELAKQFAEIFGISVERFI